MSKIKVLITGGAGFIGSHLADELLAHGYEVRVLDNLAKRAHGSSSRPTHLDPEVELIIGDVRDGSVVERALENVGAVFHFAAAVGSGDSVFEVDRCTSVNNVGTAVLMDRIVRSGVSRFILASSVSVYGEGMYRDASGARAEVAMRCPQQLRQGVWEPNVDGRTLSPVATPENKTPAASSVYAQSKYDQERMCLRSGRAFGIPTLALRFFNVFGPRQGWANPYSGELARAAMRLLERQRPRVSEDGHQTRDFVDVRDVAMACRRALEVNWRGSILNVGSGRPTSLIEVAEKLAGIVGKPRLAPEATGSYQHGEARHCFADTTRAEQILGHVARTDLDSSLREFVEWVSRQTFRKNPKSLFVSKTVEFGMGVAL